MIIERDVEIPMGDGNFLRCDVYRPDGAEPVPVIMNMGPYSKGIHYGEAHYAHHWKRMISEHPEVLEGRSTGDYMNWETVDPEMWIPHGYAVVRVDSRGAGRSPGVLDVWSPRETQDLYECIEWAGTRPWCSGRVGLSGTSYYAMNQWWVAALHPPHLGAMVAWEGANDFYREITRQGGILGNARWTAGWYANQVLGQQHGRPDGLPDHWDHKPVTGPEVLSQEELAANRVDMLALIREHSLDDEFHRSRSARFDEITTPFISAAEWAHFDLHGRGNFEAFSRAAATEKWLEVHSGHTQELYFLPYGVDLQRRFFDHFLKGVDNGFESEPRVMLNIRRAGEDPMLRFEHEWPLARTQWTRRYLDAEGPSLEAEPPVAQASRSFAALEESVTFLTAPLDVETELTGPLAAHLVVSSTTADADLFLTLQAFGPDGAELEFVRGVKDYTPLGKGWLRASHRRLDPKLSRPWRPYHSHDRIEPLTPGEPVEVDVEIWPTCVVLPAGYRLALTVGGRDFEREHSDPTVPIDPRRSSRKHADEVDRPEALFGGVTTVHTGGAFEAYLLLPVIPA